MKTLLSILTLFIMILTFNSLAFAITLQTPLVYQNGINKLQCAAVNLDNSDVEMTISSCYGNNWTAPYHVTCHNNVIVLGPGEKTGFMSYITCQRCPRCDPECTISFCEFTFQAKPENIKTGIIVSKDGIHKFIPAE